MPLNAEVTTVEILGRIPDDLKPSDLSTARVEAMRDQVCGYIEDVTNLSFSASSAYINSAKMAAISYAAALCVVYSGAVPDVNANFSPDGQLRINLSSMPKAIGNFISTSLAMGHSAMELLMTRTNLPTSNTDLVDDAT